MPLSEVARRLPWQSLFQGTYLFRRYVFAKRPERVNHIIAEDVSPEDLQQLFLQHGFMKGDYASYYYYGEDLNMVRGMFKDDEFEWYQFHIRGFAHEDGMRLRPHTELYWRVYPREHVKLLNLEIREGIELTENILEDAAIGYRVVEVEGGFDVSD